MLNAKKLGLSGGILWALCMFISTLLAVWFGYSKEFLQIMASIYPGYTVSYVGSIVGLVYGFFDGFIGLFLLAWLYNRV